MRALIGMMRQNGLSGMSIDRVARRAAMSMEEAEARSELRNRPLFDLVRQGHPVHLTALQALAATWERAASADAGLIAIVDEGFAHRLAYICAEMSPTLFDTALAMAPRPTHLFLLHAPAATITARSIERRLPAAQAGAAAKRLASTTRHEAAAHLLNRAVERLSAEGGKAWMIDAMAPPRRTARAILARIAQTT